MKLIAQIKLQPNNRQLRQLKQSIERANEAANWISGWAWENKTFGKFAIQKVIYQEIRSRFGLSAQMTLRTIAKVADAYKKDKKTQRTFTKRGSIAYDSRILSYKPDQKMVSILSLEGRLKIPFVAGEKQLDMLNDQQGETDLVYRTGQFYLFATCEIDEPDEYLTDEVLGVDMGIVNIATDSDGQKHSGSQVLSFRKRRRRQRKRLQKKGTKAARRVLKRLSGKERRSATWVNHNIAKQIVEKAKDTGRAIALENLKGIRDRARFRKPQRVNLHSWSFHQLGQFIKYKAKRAGVQVVEVHPAYTSQSCSDCGYVHRSNRQSQARFICGECGHTLHADHNAALNISFKGWAFVSKPHFSDASQSPLASGA